MAINKKVYKKIVDEGASVSKKKTSKILSVFLFFIAIIYLILPYDFDVNIIGRIDDFFFFMSSFTYMYSCFVDENKLRVSLMLKMLSAAFCIIGALTLFAFSLFM